MPKHILEQKLTELGRPGADGRIRVTILTPGRGSSGYYSPKVVEQAAPLVQPGTPMYLDHASRSEHLDRPIRSVKDIAAKFVTEGRWDAAANESYAMAELVPGPYREALLALEDSIGVSINGSATDIVNGTIDGKPEKIVEGLAKIDSVDFVTKAGRGGKFSSILESALLEADVLADVLAVTEGDGGISEATASDRMSHLRAVVRQTHRGDGKSAWVRDQDAEKKTVWFDVHDHSADGPGKTFQQNYRVGDNDVDVALTGNPVEVRPITKYVPVSPAGPSPTKESKEDTMPHIEESELARLREADGRVRALETERDTAIQERDSARTECDEIRRERDGLSAREAAVAAARARVTAGNSTLPAATVERIVAEATRDVPLTAEGALDEPALHTAVDAARTAEEAYLAGLADSTGGRLTGFGASAAATESARPTTTPFGRQINEQKGA